jgi:hypothetical protein
VKDEWRLGVRVLRRAKAHKFTMLRQMLGNEHACGVDNELQLGMGTSIENCTIYLLSIWEIPLLNTVLTQ